MALIKKLQGFAPNLGKNCFLAENATIVGDFQCGDDCSFWFQTVIRADVCRISLGDRCNIQDGAVLHGTYKKSQTTLGNDVSVGHKAIIHGCTISDQVLVGMGAIVMDEVYVESGVIIAAGALVPKGKILKAGHIYAGIPAKILSEIDKNDIRSTILSTATQYVMYKNWYLENVE